MHLLGLLAGFFAASTAPTFSHDVAPLLYRQCVSCHRVGGVAPFSLVTYQDASKRAKLLATVTAKRYMPPWLPAEPHFQSSPPEWTESVRTKRCRTASLYREGVRDEARRPQTAD